MLKHTKPQFSLGKRRYGRGPVDPVHAYLAPVAHPWCSPDASRASISGIERSTLAPCVVHCGHAVAKAASYEVNEGTNSDFIPHVVQQQWNH